MVAISSKGELLMYVHKQIFKKKSMHIKAPFNAAMTRWYGNNDGSG